ncbi:MAG: hypothetical protein A2297_02065 [Elusimicrobia bacterium RIFOXYB2_FULL_48_7]|nr:MAG: hypothetical protein A2297_02065 [Elusimicrobia bacterium RIFOXYB2_FULL_48_7]
MEKNNSFRCHLKKELRNPEFKKAYKKEDFLVRVAVEIASAREEKHMSQKELAKKMHTSQQAISRIEQGKQNVSIGMIEKIAEVLGHKPILKFV